MNARTKPPKKTTFVQIRVTEDERQCFRDKANHFDLSVSEMLRQYVTNDGKLNLEEKRST